jgi:probable HAF family extracellular repeat protein
MKIATLVCALVLFACSTVFAQTSYNFTDLGAIQANGFSQAHAINATGEITGSAGAGNLGEVFSYSDGTMTGLGTLGGSSGIGNGINASGEIAGYSENVKGTYRAFLATNGTLADIGDLGGGSAVAYAINDSGQIVGSAVTNGGANHPFLYSNGSMLDLGTLGSPNGNDWWNSAQGINNSGEVVGTSYNAQGNFFGFAWKNGKMVAMGTLGGAWSQAYAINNKGQITGLAYTKSGLAHAFVTNCATCKLKDLGPANSTTTTWGFGINDSGVVVGQATFGGGYHAFIYSGGKMQDLNKMIPAGSGWVLSEADAINNAGQIVGMALKANGEEHAYLLTPQ